MKFQLEMGENWENTRRRVLISGDVATLYHRNAFPTRPITRVGSGWEYKPHG